MISEERLRELWLESGTVTGGAIVFARSVEREAYEAAAKVCMSEYITPSRNMTDGVDGYNCAVETCAAAIRALHSGSSSSGGKVDG